MRINIERIKFNNKTRLCIISDIHHIKSCHDEFYNNIVDAVKKEKPNYILIPGDIVDHPNILNTDSVKYLLTFLSNLSYIAPVVISKGNHEIKKSNNNIQMLYDKLSNIKNLYVLDNEAIELKNYEFIGYSPNLRAYQNKYKKEWINLYVDTFKECKFNINPNKKVIMLTHSPHIILKEQTIKQLPELDNIDYVICGHMHNGLVPKSLEKMFKNNGLFGPEYTLFPKYCRGIHKINERCNLIVCKSLRVLTKDNIIFKLCNLPYANNITIIDI